MFNELSKDLGHLKVGKKVEIFFEYKAGAVITQMITPCDCANIVDLTKDHKVKITYIPKPLPAHLKQEGKTFYKTEKNFTIHALVNGVNSPHTISFTAIISG